jgi:hypothetical protein
MFRRHNLSSVLIDNLDVVRIFVFPPKANAPLVVDANAVLTPSVPAQCFEPIASWNTQVLKRGRSMQVQEFSQRLPLDRAKLSDELVIEQPDHFGHSFEPMLVSAVTEI